MTSMTEVIDVDTDPVTAFSVFTDEFDQWWGRGPIDAYLTWRLVERRIEGGVGGRLVEDYGDEERVLGTITIWEPGARLAWMNRNDVTIEVTFEAHASGTRVRVTGTVPTDVEGTEELAMVRMAPQWLPRYLARRTAGDSQPDYGRLHLALRSATPAATARWLADVFQLEPTGDIPHQERDADYTWIEFRVGSSFIVLWGGGGTVGSDAPFIYVDDLDSHLKHTEAAGATIVSPITEHGFRSYTAADCEGRHWVFAQSGPRLGR
ncbi:MAG: SRPBCC domain-containing protein [Actinobacteria bacterium]|nr:SRPBCC domain-containing protein [Actinomycetota bacterium]